MIGKLVGTVTIFKTYYRSFDSFVWILFLGTLINAVGIGIFYPFLTIYMKEQINISMSSIGLLLALQSIVGIIAQPLVGLMIGKFNKRLALIIIMSAVTLVDILYIFSKSIILIAIVLFFSGLFVPMYYVVRNVIVGESVSSDKRTEVNSILLIAFNGGQALGASIGGFLAVFSYTYVFLVNAITTFLFTMLLIFKFRYKDNSSKEQISNYSNTKEKVKITVVWKHKRFLLFCIGTIFIITCNAQLFSTFPVYLKEHLEINEMHYGIIISINMFAIMIFQLPLSILTKNLRKITLMTLGALMFCCSLIGIYFAEQFLVFFPIILFVSFGCMLFFPTSTSYVADVSPQNYSGHFYGVFGGASSLGYTIAPLLGGYLYEKSTGYLWFFLLIISFLSFAIFNLLRKEGSENVKYDIK